MKQFLHELVFGESINGKSFTVRRVHANEDGNISMSALFVMLAFFVLIGFLGNAGQAVFRKLETQNAADSMAHSSTVWVARHMNAITATNHLMGELSAIIVLAEGFGGPELDGEKEPKARARSDPGWESVFWNNRIQHPVTGAKPLPGLFRDALDALGFDEVELVTYYGSVGAALRNADQQYVDFLVDVFGERRKSAREQGRHDACATIYDGQLTMKSLVWYGLRTKLVSNAVYLAGTAISLGTGEFVFASLNLGVHLAVDLALLPVIKDWYLTQAVELFASALRPIRDPVLPLVIQGLSMHADAIADPVALRDSLTGTLDESARQFRLEAYALFPLERDLSLPIMREGEPKNRRGMSMPPSQSRLRHPDHFLAAAIKKPLDKIQGGIDRFNSLIPKVTVFGKTVVVPPFKEIPGVVDLSNDGLPKRLAMERGGGFGFEKNPSFKHLSEYTSTSEMDWVSERRSQWVRATYPHVDELRRPVCEVFKRFIPTANMHTYYVHWTNRYTISVCHRLRSTAFGSGPGKSNSNLLADRLAEIRKKLDELRREFSDFLDDANAVASDANDTLGDLQRLSNGLEELGNLIRTSGAIDQISSSIPIDEWLRAATGHVEESRNLGRSTRPDDGLDVDVEDFQLIVQSIAWINYVGYLLDALDTMLARLEALVEFGPPHMYVMKDSSPENKGEEPWTDSPSAAESLFAIQVFVKRETPKAILTPPLYPNPNSKGVLAVAEAMVYNANGRNMESTSEEIQPNTGWDLLNWNAPVKAREWGPGESTPARAGDFSRIFSTGLKNSEDRQNSIHLNWQGKLVPVGPGRLRTAAQAPQIKDFFGLDSGNSLLSQPDFIMH